MQGTYLGIHPPSAIRLMPSFVGRGLSGLRELLAVSEQGPICTSATSLLPDKSQEEKSETLPKNKM